MALSAQFCNFYKNLRNRRAAKLFCGYVQANYSDSLSLRQNNDSDILQPTSEDLSSVTPYFESTFNLAAYVNNSDTLKNLVNLNVDLSRIEKKPHIVEKILKLDFDRDMKKHIIYLSDFVGMDGIGNFITKNPLILCEALDDLEVRVNYLESKGFKNDQIMRIITANPFWLMFR